MSERRESLLASYNDKQGSLRMLLTYKQRKYMIEHENNQNITEKYQFTTNTLMPPLSNLQGNDNNTPSNSCLIVTRDFA